MLIQFWPETLQKCKWNLLIVPLSRLWRQGWFWTRIRQAFSIQLYQELSPVWQQAETENSTQWGSWEVVGQLPFRCLAHNEWVQIRKCSVFCPKWDHLPLLQSFDPAKHIHVAGRVLLYHILHVVGSERFLELPSGYEVLDLPECSNSSFVHFCQSDHSLNFFIIWKRKEIVVVIRCVDEESRLKLLIPITQNNT